MTTHVVFLLEPKYLEGGMLSRHMTIHWSNVLNYGECCLLNSFCRMCHQHSIIIALSFMMVIGFFYPQDLLRSNVILYMPQCVWV